MVACTAGSVDVEVQAATAARVRMTSATPAAPDLRQRVNIYTHDNPAPAAAIGSAPRSGTERPVTARARGEPGGACARLLP